MTLSPGGLPFFLPTSRFHFLSFSPTFYYPSLFLLLFPSLLHPFFPILTFNSSSFCPTIHPFPFFHHPSFSFQRLTRPFSYSFSFKFCCFFNRFCIVCLRLSDYKILRSARRKVQFVVKYKTEHLVDLELILPSRTLTMDDVRIETGGFIPRGNPLMNLMQMSSRKYAF